MKATNIEWDIGSETDLDILLQLPDEIVIPDGIKDEGEMRDYVDEICDYISDITGFCHKGFVLEV